MTNQERAEKTLKCLYEYTDLGAPGEDTAPDAIETYAGDLIADLKHLCYYGNVDFDEALRRGQGHFEAELHEEGLAYEIL